MTSSDRYQPVMPAFAPEDLFERICEAASRLPEPLGHVFHRKLKRRYRKRHADVFTRLVADLRPGDLCIDLGGNVGDVSRKFLERGADVIVFEPDPDTFEVLRANLAGHPNATLLQKGAGVENTTLRLRRAARLSEDPGKFSQAASFERQDRHMDDSNSVAVEVVDFVAFLRDLDRPVRILKIDIEGSEWDLMEALLADPVAQHIDAIFVETHERFAPRRYMPVFNRLRDLAVRLERPYVNLFWY